MGDLVLLDNDVVLKTACYGTSDHLRRLLSKEGRSLAGLGLAKFVLRRNIRKSNRINDREKAFVAMEALLAWLDAIEPDAKEVALAASFEAHAQAAGLALDPGESQLLAVLVRRAATALLTGDKRAVVSVDRLASDLGIQPAVGGRLACFEQVMVGICEQGGFAEIGALVCAEELVDKTMSICFGCSSGGASADEARTGLLSYVEDLRRRSGAVLTMAFSA
jgi:hypothetical protein